MNGTSKNSAKFNKAINTLLGTQNIDPSYVPLDLDSLTMAVLVDAGFGSNQALSSKLGSLLTLIADNGNSNIIHEGSLKSKRVTGSVLVFDLFAMLMASTCHGRFDVASTR